MSCYACYCGSRGWCTSVSYVLAWLEWVACQSVKRASVGGVSGVLAQLMWQRGQRGQCTINQKNQKKKKNFHGTSLDLCNSRNPGTHANCTILAKIYETNFSVSVKLRTTGKVQFQFSNSLLLVLTKFSSWREDWTLGYNSMKI